MKEAILNKTSKKYFIIILIILIIPGVYHLSKLPDLSKLKGDIKEIKQPELTLENWFSEIFQQKEEKYLNQHFGFRSFFVRINNQIAFSLFKKAKANGVIIGKENYLYEKSYIETYFGRDFIGKEKIDEKLRKIKAIQDTLIKLDKNLIVILAAGKGSFYPEYIPDDLKSDKTISNYDYYASQLKEKKINSIDFNDWFVKMKGKTKYLLYPKTGIHWSFYGEVLVADSIAKYTKHLFNKDLPNITWKKDIIPTKKYKGADRDIEKAMNMLFRISNFKMAYPEIKYINKGKERISSIVISDSFYWGLFNNNFSNNFFKNGKFWYYNQTVYPDNYKKPTKTKDLDLKKEIERTDLIILLATEATLYKFPYGVDDDLYKHFFDTKINKDVDNISEKEIINLINYIRTDKKWIKHISEKAKKRNISIDSMLRLDAIYSIKINKKGK